MNSIIDSLKKRNKLAQNIQTFNDDLKRLNDNYENLSDINKKKVINYSDNLLAIQRMEEEQSHLIPEAAHDRTDIDVTPDMVKKDDDIMDNDDEWK